MFRWPPVALATVLLASLGPSPVLAPAPHAAEREVVVHEGTSMAVAVSPDGRTLAIDLQGSIWVLPAGGGTAQRITDEFNDARQPSWSPDGRWVAFQGFRDGGFDIWAVAVDGKQQKKLTDGPWDDREPAWSHDGRRVAFASDRGDAGNYNIWVADVATGAVQQVTRDPADDYMPTWAPGDSAIAFVSARAGGQGIYAVHPDGGADWKAIVPRGRADAPSWSPTGELLVHITSAGESRYELAGSPQTGSENVFAFRASWPATGEAYYYVSDGKIRRRSFGGAVQTIEFSATLRVTETPYTRRVRDVDARAPRPALGIVQPAISPDGKQVAYVALGDLWVSPVGGKGAAVNLTHDRYLDAEPAWSPDGTQLAWSSDRGGSLLDLWIRDMQTGAERRLTSLPTSAMGAAWSPDGSRIAFLDVDGVWRRANVSVVDVGSGTVTKLHESMFGPGSPTWSPDGKRVAVAALRPYSARFREGTNQVLTISAAGGDDRWYTPVPHLSIDSRVGAGPVWSPDGTMMAVVYEGMLSIVPVSASGEPLGPPRRLTNEMAHAPTWTADSREILYQSMNRMRVLEVATGATRDVPLQLTYAPSIPTERYLIHAGTLVDMVTPTARENVDIVIVGNRIRQVVPHNEALHRGLRVVDATGKTVMPGLIEYHTHLQKDLGEAHLRAYLGFGITTVRSPGSTPYEAVEDREAVDAGVRPGPRVFATGYLLEWQRTYYKMAVAISSPAHLELELQRAQALQHDLLKSYVRMPDIQQRRIVEFAHSAGVPAASHEVFPSTLVGIDATEHLTGTSRRGYSPKVATLQRSYADVIGLFGAAGVTLTPTMALSGASLRRLIASEPALKVDPRFALYPPWLRAQVQNPTAAPPGAPANLPPPPPGDPAGEMIRGALKAGARVVGGTDTPNAFNLHAELTTYVAAGLSTFEALKTVTVTPAAALGLPAGTVQTGRLADLAIVDGNPLEDITRTHRVRWVIANGRVYDVADLVQGRLGPKTAGGAGR